MATNVEAESREARAARLAEAMKAIEKKEKPKKPRTIPPETRPTRTNRHREKPEAAKKEEKAIEINKNTVAKALTAHDPSAIIALAKNKQQVEKLLSSNTFREKLSQSIIRSMTPIMQKEPGLADVLADMEGMPGKLALVRDFLYSIVSKRDNAYATEIKPLDKKSDRSPLDVDTFIAAAAYLRRLGIKDQTKLSEVLPLLPVTPEEKKAKQEAAPPPPVKLERTETPLPDFREYRDQVAERLAKAKEAEEAAKKKKK